MKCNKTKTGPSSGAFVEAERKCQERHEQIKFLHHAADNGIAQLHIFDLSTFWYCQSSVAPRVGTFVATVAWISFY